MEELFLRGEDGTDLRLPTTEESGGDTTRETEAVAKNVSFAAANHDNNETEDVNNNAVVVPETEDTPTSLPTTASSSSPPPRRRLSEMKSTYFDFTTGRRMTATRDHQSAVWKSTNKAVRLLKGDAVAPPCSSWQRTMRRFGMASSTTTSQTEATEDSANHHHNKDGTPAASVRHYRIQSRATHNDNPNVLLDSVKGASMLSDYLRWTFHTTFWHVILASFVQFLGLSVFFAILIYIIDTKQPECISGASRKGSNNRIAFGDAYHLSWTTISTVGYGVISPGLASTTEGVTRCMGINVLMATESFVGVLFGGLTGGTCVRSRVFTNGVRGVFLTICFFF
jgi:hypothetical protein